jgi:hypothetical protein
MTFHYSLRGWHILSLIRGRTAEAAVPQNLGCRNPANQVFLLLLAFRADGEGVEYA